MYLGVTDLSILSPTIEYVVRFDLGVGMVTQQGVAPVELRLMEAAESCLFLLPAYL